MKKTISLFSIISILSFVAIAFILTIAVEESYRTTQNFYRALDNHIKMESLSIEEILSSHFSKIYDIFNQTITIDLKKLKDTRVYFDSIDDYIEPITKLLNKNSIFGSYDIYLFDKNRKIYKSSFEIDNLYNIFKKSSFNKVDNNGLLIDMSAPIFNPFTNDIRRYLFTKSKNGEFFIQISHNYNCSPLLKKQIVFFKDRFKDIKGMKIFILSDNFAVDILDKSFKRYSLKKLEEIIKKDLNLKKVDKLKLRYQIDKNNESAIAYLSFKIGFSPVDRSRVILKLEFNLKNKFKSYKKALFRLWVIIFMSLILISGIILTIKLLVIDNIYKIISALNRKMPIKNSKIKIKEFEILISTIESYRDALYKRNKELEILASIDSMTGCFNRRVFNEKLDELFYQYQRYKRGFGLIIFDIDNFKKINDKYGHQRGDTVLIEFSKRLRSHLRKSDLCFRIGGEEFAILILNGDEKEAINLAHKIREIIEKEPFDKDLKVTVSVGVDIIRDDKDSISLFNRVDQYSYISKKRGKNRVTSFYDI